MWPTYIIIGLAMMLIGILSGAITAVIIRYSNKKSVVKPPQEYSQYDREKLMADQETLLKGREDYASKEFK